MKNITKKIFLLTTILFLLIGVVNASEITDDATTTTVEQTTTITTDINDNTVSENTNTKEKTDITKNNKEKNIKKANNNEKIIVDNISYDANNASLLVVKARQVNSTSNKTVYPDYDLSLYVNTNNHTTKVKYEYIEDYVLYFYYRINTTGKHNLLINSSNLGNVWSKNITINKVYSGKTKLNLEIINYTKNIKTNESLSVYAKLTNEKNQPLSGYEIFYYIDTNGYEYQYHEIVDKNGYINISSEFFVPGKITVGLKPTFNNEYLNEKYFNYTSKKVNITCTKRDIPNNLTIEFEDTSKKTDYGSSYIVYGYVKDKNGNSVEGIPINITSDKKFTFFDNRLNDTVCSRYGGMFSIIIFDAEVGNHTLTLTIDDAKYKNKSTKLNFEVLPLKLNISLDNIPSNITKANVVNITAHLSDSYGLLYLYDNDIIFEINNKQYPSYSLMYGSTCNFYVNKTGNYTVKVTSNKTNYEKVNISKTFTVKSLNTTKINEDISLDLINMTNKTKTVTYNIMTSTKYYNVPLVVKINNFTDYIYSGDGSIIYNYTPKDNGVYNISVAYNTKSFNPNKVNSTFTIKNWYTPKDNVTIKANKINITSLNKTTVISGKLYNQNNKTLANKTVIIQDGSFKTQVKTDKNGSYSYIYNVTSGNGTHNVTITVPATDTNNQANITQTFKCRTPTEIFINYTQAYVNKTINITVTIKNPLNYSVVYPNAKLTVKVANTTYNTKTNANGLIPLNYTTTKEETINVTATFVGSSNYDPSNKTIQIKIVDYLKELENKVKEYEKIIKNQNTTIKNLNTTVKNQNNTIKTMNTTINNQNKTITSLNNSVKSLNSTVASQNKTINSLNNTVKSQNSTIKTMNTTINNQDKTIASLNNTVKSLNSTVASQNKTINSLNNTVKSQNSTIKTMNTTINNQNKTIASLNNIVKSLNNTVKNQNNTIKSLNSIVTGQNKTISSLNSTVKSLNSTVKSQNSTIKSLNNTVSNQNKNINTLNNTIKSQNNTVKSLNANITKLQNQIKNITTKLDTKITINKITGSVGKTTQISANVVDVNNNKVNEGFVLFKVNGISLKDKVGNNIYVPVRNGTAKLNYEVPKSWISNASNIKAIFTETQHYKVCEVNKTGLFNISNGTVKIKLADMATHENGDNTQFVVTVTDLNNNPMDGGRVIVKVNGLTLKDENKRNVEANVTNGIAIIDYKIAIGARNHNITAVYAYTGYNRVETSNTLKVIKAEPFIRYTPITTKSNKTVIQATIVDKYKSLLYYNVTFVMSVNGKKYNTTAIAGKVNLTIPTDFNKGVYRLSMAVYETGAFKSDSLTSVLIKE